MPSKMSQFLAQATRAQQSQPTAAQNRAAEVRDLYKQGLKQLRGQRNMHPDVRRIEAARLYATTQAALTKLRNDHAAEDHANLAKLERQMWGYDDVRATATDRATTDTTIRDAQDRAAQIKKPEHAAQALAQAEQTGDHILARAIGKRAHDMDWDDVLHDYLATRPTTEARYHEAGAIWHRTHATEARMHNGMQYVVHKPEELRGVSDQDIAAMTTDPADTAA